MVHSCVPSKISRWEQQEITEFPYYCHPSSRQLPDTWHPRGKDIELVTNCRPNATSWHQHGEDHMRVSGTDPAPSTRIKIRSHQSHAHQSNNQPQIVPTAFTQLPTNNQPLLPPSIQIPTTYSRPTALLPHSWPKGNAYQQREVARPQAQWVPAMQNQIYPQTSLVPQVFPTQAIHQPTPNANQQLSLPPQYHPNLYPYQHWHAPQPPYLGNPTPGIAARNRAPGNA